MFTGFNSEFRQMRISSFETMFVINVNYISKRVRKIRHADYAIACCVNGGSVFGGEIKSFVWSINMEDRMESQSIRHAQLLQLFVVNGLNGWPRCPHFNF